MGICASNSHLGSSHVGIVEFPSAKVVDLDGRLHEFRRRITAAEILSEHQKCFLCSADGIVINSVAPQLPKEHVLQFGQIYFLLPLSKSLTPLYIHDLCALAVKASAALRNVGYGKALNRSRRARLSGGSCKDILTF